MRSVAPITLLVLATLISPSAVCSQSTPDPGVIDGHTYSNEFFRLTWEFPKEWVVTNHAEELGSHPLVRLRPSGEYSPEYFQVGYNDPEPEFEKELLRYSDPEPRYEEDLQQKIKENGWDSIEGRRSETFGGGVQARRFDFRSRKDPNLYLSVAVGPLRGYRLSIAAIATSTAKTQELITAALTMHIRPDWPADAQASVAQPTKQGPPPTRVRVSKDVLVGMLVYEVPPIYPENARKAHAQGTVVLLGHINVDGTVQDLYVQDGNPLLIPAALKSVSQWRYRPYLLKGKPVAVETQIIENFTLAW